MVFSYHQDGLRISTCAVNAKWNGAHDDSIPFRGALATSSTEIHRGTLPVVCTNDDVSYRLDLRLKRVWSIWLTPRAFPRSLVTVNGAKGSLDIVERF